MIILSKLSKPPKFPFQHPLEIDCVIKDIEANSIEKIAGTEELQLLDLKQRIIERENSVKLKKALQFVSKVKKDTEVREAERANRIEEFQHEIEAINQQKVEMTISEKLKKKQMIQKYFEQVRAMHEKKKRLALEKAIGNSPETKNPDNDRPSSEKTKVIKNPRFISPAPAIRVSSPKVTILPKAEDTVRYKSIIEKIKSERRPPDYEELATHRMKIDLLTKDRREKMKKLEVLLSSRREISAKKQSFKMKNNSYLIKKDYLLKKANKIRNYSETVREKLKESRPDDLSVPVVLLGHEAEVIAAKERIERNRMLPLQFLKHSRSVGQALRKQRQETRRSDKKTKKKKEAPKHIERIGDKYLSELRKLNQSIPIKKKIKSAHLDVVCYIYLIIGI